ncbi:MAG: asparagine--tRNA ligase [Deltaproteobacteria bacterium]|nr:asparagine--tRNA ligase [Deltaproteobacteria bacterium]
MSKKWVYIQDLGSYVGQEITLKGWVYNTRSSGSKIKFLLLRDGTGYIQCVLFQGETLQEYLDQFSLLTQESSVIVTGIVREEKRALGGFELGLTSFEIVHKTEDYPITPKEHGTGFLMDQRHLWIRSKRQHAVLRVRAEVIRLCREFFDKNGFLCVDAPILTPSACEGTTTLFEVGYFGEKAYLTQSGQLYSEATARAFGKVYCFGPTFRAEKSKTRKHLTEFWMLEPEVSFATLDENMELAENLVEYVIQKIMETREPELKSLERNCDVLKKYRAPFERLHYNDAAKMLEKGSPDFKYGSDFGAPQETFLTSKYDKPFFVHRFPKAIKAFYMKQDPEDATLSLSCDLLAPEGYGEVIGGGCREESIDVLLKEIEKHKLDQKDFEWYLDLRRYGSAPSAGFGLGIERAVAWICGIEHVRETIPFPRMLERLRP